MKELAAEHLHVWRGDTHLLRDLTFQVRAGQCLQVIGRNGAGKTTLLRSLCGLTPIESGRVLWCGEETARSRDGFHDALAFIGHDAALKADLSARENLHFGVGLRRRIDARGIDTALARVELGALDRPVRSLSAGQRRRVALAQLLLLDCPLWILDEPTSNLDASGQRLVGDLLAAHLAGGGLAVVATHQLLGLGAGALATLEIA